MATVPSTRTWVAGEVVLDTHFNNNIRDVLNFLLARPIFRGRQTVAQTLTTGIGAVITFDTEDVDNAGGHSTVTNTSRYTAVYAGWYSHSGGVSFVANAAGIRASSAAVNGTVINGAGATYAPTSAGVGTAPVRAYMAFLNVGDYLEFTATQTSGGNLNTNITTDNQSSMALRWESN